jgi:Inosine-uridine preferring nucleoside hydrolase
VHLRLGDIAPPLATGSTAGGDLRHVVLDTDLASEDIFALLYLMQRDDVAIEAVTITGTGEAHCDPGVRNALSLLALGERTDVPVACGRDTPLQGSNAFPQGWRDAADDLSMVDLPDAVGDLSGPAGLPRPRRLGAARRRATPGHRGHLVRGQGMAEAETTGPTVVGVCFVQQRSGRPVGAWLSPPVSVST